MSSMSAQGVVERASAELSKRINGLGLRSSKPHVAKGSVMERVTNVFCGGSNNAAFGAPEKPSRLLPSRGLLKSNFLTRKLRQPPQHLYLNWNQLMMDERFLTKFFLYFNAYDRCTLAQVCTRWRDILYRSPRYWSGLVPVLQCRELRGTTEIERARLYASLLVKGFYTLCLMGASDEDAVDLVNTFPLASEHIHTLSLRCSSITDRGLETLLDHLQALYELELAGCNEITEAGLWACLNPRIVSLTLTDCINVADEAVGAVAQLLPALYEFSLQAYHVTDAALTYFSPKQQYSIGVLRLHSCWEITSQGVITIAATMKNLTVLSLSGCSKITDEALEAIAEYLKGLKSLDLSWCPRITDHGLENIACDLNQLEELILDRCINLTDNGCPLLTCSGLSTVIQLRHLKELELTNCPGASRELFDYLREHLPRCLIIE